MRLSQLTTWTRSARLLVVTLAASAVAGCATAPRDSGRPPALAADPLPLADCLDPDRARSFVLLDSSTLLVDAGRRRYQVKLAHACPELGTTHSLQFRPGGGVGRLCGGAMETVLPVGGRPPVRPCPISALRLLDEDAYQALLDGGEVTARGTVTPDR